MKWTLADKLWQDIFEDRGVRVTKEWAKAEVRKCAKDPIYFINQYCLVRNRAEDTDALPPGCRIYGDMLDFVLFDIQAFYLKSLMEGQNIVACKTRQSGVSVSTGLFLLHQLTFRNNKEYIVISKSERESMKFLDDLKTAHRFLPFFLRRPAFESNKKTLALGGEYNASYVRALTSGKGSGRSYTATMLIMDEAAFIPDAESIWAAASPILTTTGGKAVLISTPWEDQGLFFDVVEGARNKRNGFDLVEIPWTSIPGRDEDWYQRECEKLQHITHLIQTELDMRFIRRGTAFFPEDRVRELKSPPIKAQIKGNAWMPIGSENVMATNEFNEVVSFPTNGIGHVFDFYQPGTKYIVSHDPAEDGTKSKHAISVLDLSNFPSKSPRIVLEYMSAENVFGTLYDLTEYYQAKLVLEKNRGFAVTQHFISEGAESRLFVRPNGQVGIVTNTATREMLLKIVSKYISMDIDDIPPILKNEVLGFMTDSKGKLKGRAGDDMIFAVGIGMLALTLYPDLFGFCELTEDQRLKLIAQVKGMASRTISSNTTDILLDRIREGLGFQKELSQQARNLPNQTKEPPKFGLTLPM